MKAVLVIDMPKSCEECDYLGWATHDEDMRACMLLNGYFFTEAEVETKRSEVCPLKPMPTGAIPIEFLKDKIAENESWGCNGYAKGLQSAIDEWVEWNESNISN